MLFISLRFFFSFSIITRFVKFFIVFYFYFPLPSLFSYLIPSFSTFKIQYWCENKKIFSSLSLLTRILPFLLNEAWSLIPCIRKNSVPGLIFSSVNIINLFSVGTTKQLICLTIDFYYFIYKKRYFIHFSII